ncbi:MAG: oligosaccharide flippase family protein, partial [Bacteroidia bacterium]
MSLTIKAYQKNFVTMLTGNTLSQLIPFLIAPTLARIYSPEQFAVFANFMAIAGMIGIVATGRLELAIPLPKEKIKAKHIVITGLLICVALSILSFIIPLNANKIAMFYNNENLTPYLWYVPISIVSFGLFALSNNWALRNKKIKNISTSKILQSLINNGAAALLGYIGWGINGMIIAWLCSQFIAILIFSIGVNKRKIVATDYTTTDFKNTVYTYKDFLTINSLHAFADLFMTQFLLFWIISMHYGNTELGLFSQMVKYLKAPVVLICSSVSQLFFIEASTALQNNVSVKPVFYRTLKTTLFFAIPFVIIVYLFGPTIFKLYLGNQWIASGTYAQLYLPVLFLMFFVSPVSTIPILFGKQKKSFLITLLGYALSLGSFFISVNLGWEFNKALLLYSCLNIPYYVFLLFWYYS